MVFRYLHNYKKIHFDVPNFDLSKKQVDSVKRSQPFCTLTVTKTTGKPMRLRMFRAKSETGNETIDDFNTSNIDEFFIVIVFIVFFSIQFGLHRIIFSSKLVKIIVK
jgi:hypothetical protein